MFITYFQTKENEEDKNSTKALFDENLLHKMADKTSDLINFLFDFSNSSTLKTTYGQEIEPLGLNKIRIIEMIGCMMRLNNVKVNQNLALHGFFLKLLVILIFIFLMKTQKYLFVTVNNFNKGNL
jgi:hypothetical protein